MKSNELASLIILNWNGGEDTKECLLSLSSLRYDNFEVVLVDNGSKDGSVEELEKYIQKKKFSYDIKFIKNEKNLGFTGGNIEGLRYCEGKYIVLLNNDTVVDPQWLTELVGAVESSNKIGVAGGRAYKWNEDNPKYNKNNEYYSCQKIDPWLGYAYTLEDIKEESEADSISGCAVIIKKEVIDKVGFLDEVFFAYYEETDLFARAIRAGYKVVYNPKAEVWHQVAKSSGGQSYFYTYQMSRNRAIFVIRNFDDDFYKYFKNDYFRKNLRLLFSYYLRHRNNDIVKAQKDAFLWVLKNWFKLQDMRSIITNKGSYNNKLSLFSEETVSVVIPNYNYEKYIVEAIKSAQKQTVKPFEIIVIDDGSTDNSVKIIKKHDVKLIEQKNQGVVNAKNAGAKLAKGRFLLFLDADDILRKNAIEEYLKKYRKDKSVGFLYSNMEYFGAFNGVFEAKEFSNKSLRPGNYIHNSALIKKEAFFAVGGYHERARSGFEDWDLYISLAEEGYTGSHVDKVLLDYRQHEGTLGRNKIDNNNSSKIIFSIMSSHKRLFPIYYRIPRKIYLKAHYGAESGNLIFKIILFALRIMLRFFTLLKLILTLRWKEATSKVKSELSFWGTLCRKGKKNV